MNTVKRIILWVASERGSGKLTPRQRDLIEQMDAEHERFFGSAGPAKQLRAGGGKDAHVKKICLSGQRRHFPHG
jgi:hypothetical protein